jgi:hypothetical protein
VFYELKPYLTSLLVMVAPELGEPLLLYITAIAKVVSMVLVKELPEPHKPQAQKGAPAVGFGSQDPDPARVPGDKETVGS